MSASIALSDGVLVLRANPTTPSHMTVNLSHHGMRLDAYVSGAGMKHFNAADVSAIEVDGSSRGDDGACGGDRRRRSDRADARR